MTATIEIIKNNPVTIKGLQNIIEVMYYESIDIIILDNNKTIEVFGDGTYILY